LNDGRNEASLEAIRQQADEVSRLRAEIEELRPRTNGLAGRLLGPRLAEIQASLTTLGDPAGAADAAALLGRINETRTTTAAVIAFTGLAITVLLLVRRTLGLRHVPPPEARLQR
jgi:hypothetical protein